MNTERKKDQVDQVSYEVFEIIMDRLEKEWFELVSTILLLSIPWNLAPSLDEAHRQTRNGFTV